MCIHSILARNQGHDSDVMPTRLDQQQLYKTISNQFINLVNRQQSLKWEMSQQSFYLDIKNKYIRDIYEIYPHKTHYFTRYIAHNTHPSNSDISQHSGQDPNSSIPLYSCKQGMCYIYVPERLADIYANPYQIFNKVSGLGDRPLDEPCQPAVQFFSNLFHQYQQVYGADQQEYILQGLFGPQGKKNQFIEKHLKPFSTNISKQSNRYSKQNKIVLQGYNRNKVFSSPATYQQFEVELASKLSIIPIQYGEDRLYAIVKFARQLLRMFGIQVLADRDWAKTKKILIKCDMVELKSCQLDGFYQKFKLIKPRIQEQPHYLNFPLPKLMDKFKNAAKSQSGLEQHRRLKIKFLKQITEQLIQYEFLTGSEYPHLHPDYIWYNNRSDHFTLTPVPVMIQALGFPCPESESDAIKDQIYYQKSFLQDVGWKSCQQVGKLQNIWKMIILMHYFEMGSFKKGAKLSLKTNRCQEMLSVLFSMTKKQIQEEVAQLKNQLIYNKEKGIEYERCLLQQKSYAKTILLLFLLDSKLQPSLTNLTQIFPLSYRISSLSPSRHEQVLYLRYKAIKLTHKNVVGFIEDMNKFYNKNNEEHSIILKENIVSLHLVQIALFLVSMDLKDLLRPCDQAIHKQIEEVLHNMMRKSEEILVFLTGLQREQKGMSSFCRYLKIVVRKLTYICKHSGSEQKDRMTILYSKVLKRILVFMKQNEKPNKNEKVYSKYYENKGENNFQYIRLITGVVVQVVLKMNSSNIHWCEYFILRKLAKLMEEEQVTKKGLESMGVQLKNKQEDEESEWLMWGTLRTQQAQNDKLI